MPAGSGKHAENRTSSYQQIHAIKSSKLKSEMAKVRKNTVLNLGNLDFEIVSDFDIRISDLRLPVNSL